MEGSSGRLKPLPPPPPKGIIVSLPPMGMTVSEPSGIIISSSPSSPPPPPGAPAGMNHQHWPKQMRAWHKVVDMLSHAIQPMLAHSLLLTPATLATLATLASGRSGNQ